MKQMSPADQYTASRLTAILAIGLGFFGTLFLSPKWLMPVFAWVAPVALLFFSRSAPFKRKWLILYLSLFLSGLIATYEVLPMPMVVLIIFSLLDAAKNLLIYFFDTRFRTISNRFIYTLFFPSAMVAKEYIESMGGGGVWGSLANTQFEFPWLTQLASVTGIWGISFLLYWFASVICWIVPKITRKEKFAGGLVIYASFLLLVLGFGAWRYNSNYTSGQGKVRIAGLSVPTMIFLESLQEDVTGKKVVIDPLVSQSSPQLQEVNKAFLSFIENPDSTNFSRSFSSISKIHDSLFVLSGKAAREGARMITWSEGNGLVLQSRKQALLQRGMDFAGKYKVYLLMTMAVIEPGKITAGKKFIENIAVLLGPDGRILNVLHKNKPVPMAENSVPGDQVVPVISTPFGNLSTSICYDADFPQLMNQLGKKKADVLFLPSGDWHSIAPYHSYMAAIRGIENGCSVVRQVSGGLSIISDYRGKISLTHDFFSEGEKLWVTEARFGHVSTVYSIIGDIWAYSCLLYAVGIILYLLGRSARVIFLKR